MASPGEETLVATVVAQQWKDIGLDVSVRTLSSSVYVNNYGYGYYDMGVILTNHPLSMDFVMNKFFYPQVTPIGKSTYYRGWTRWANDSYKELMELSRSETNPAKLHEIYNKAQQIIAEDLPFLSLYYEKNIWAYRTDTFEGWEPMKDGFNWPMSELVCSLHLPAVKVTPEKKALPVEWYVVGIILVVAFIATLFYVFRKH
jgi:ABC-type transport system substrate-binding protein